MRLPKELTTVTPLSRIVAVIVFIAIIIIGFGLGINYQETIDLQKQQNNLTPATIIKPTGPISLPSETSVRKGDETANWKTYVNSKYNFEFKYPPSWSAIASAAPGKPYLAFINLGSTDSIQSGGVMAVTVRNQTENDFISVLVKEGFQTTQRGNVLLGGANASHYKLNKTLHSGEKSELEIIIAMKNGVLYEINGGTNLHEQYKNIRYRNVYDQILSTFQFLN